MRYFWVISLCFFFVGCNKAYVGVPLVPTGSPPEQQDEFHPQVDPGTEIRLTLKDGRIIKARLVEFRDDSLVIEEARIEGGSKDSFSEIQQPESEPSSKHYKVPLSDLALLEKSNVDTKKQSVSTVLAVGGIFLSIAFLVAVDWDDYD